MVRDIYLKGFSLSSYYTNEASDINIVRLEYHILHAIRFKLRINGIHDSWSNIRQSLFMHIRNSTTQKK